MIRSFALLCCFVVCISFYCKAQLMESKPAPTRADTLRGTIGPDRAWWDVLYYDVTVTPDYATKTIKGRTTISYKVVLNKHSDYLQIDLQQPLNIDTIFYDNKLYINFPGKPYHRIGNAWRIPLPHSGKGEMHSISIAYSGKPKEAVRAPWDGGWIWQKDAKGRPWMSVACQGLGASVWYPCKDHQSDEPDSGARLTVTVPKTLTVVGNGRLKKKTVSDNNATFIWSVTEPINSYNLVPYIGHYSNFSEKYSGLNGALDCNYWVLDYNLEKAKSQFVQVPQMLKAFEHWFGPFPFYADGYQLVEAPHLGMEHQSAIAYGNKYMNGYLGSDLSGSGWGRKWDYIIVHESGHEWFANNITTKDIADMWVHEGFTDYSETLFTEYYYGKKAGDEYCAGLRDNIQNDLPIIGPYGVNREGSGDMYYKGANLIHTIRSVINNDSLFRNILTGLNKTFYHQTVTSKQVEDYISRQSGTDFSKVFDQYLRTTKVPVLVLQQKKEAVHYRWEDVVPGFAMPVLLTNGTWLKPTTSWQTLKTENKLASISADNRWYIKMNKN